MLLFIFLPVNPWASLTSFNTSHVTLYQICTISLRLLQLRFNTSHVTLYPDPPTRVTHNKKFQYISCYSLSILISERSQIKTGFNTSHVTLYLRYGAGLIPRCCFNTSHVTLYRKATKGWQRNNVVSIHLMLLFIVFKLLNKEKKQRFQYISCYSLSWEF